MRECAPHLGQTLWLPSRSFFQMICRHPSHFSQRPSVRMWRAPCSDVGVDFSRLNQDMGGGKTSQKSKGKRQKSKVFRPVLATLLFIFTTLPRVRIPSQREAHSLRARGTFDFCLLTFDLLFTLRTDVHATWQTPDRSARRG